MQWPHHTTISLSIVKQWILLQHQDGYYKSLLNKCSYIKITGEKVSSHETGREVFDRMAVQLGEFGPAGEKIRELTGKQNYNINMVMFWDKDDPEKEEMKTNSMAHMQTTLIQVKEEMMKHVTEARARVRA